MASIGEDRDRLLKAFLDSERRRRRSRKPSVNYKPPKQGARTYHSYDPATARKILYGKGSFNAQVKGAEKVGKKIIKKLNPFD